MSSPETIHSSPEVPITKQENAERMPNDHPKKQGLFAGISDMLRKLSNSLGMGTLFGLQEWNKSVNKIQEFFSSIIGIFQGIDIEKWTTIKEESDIAKIREAFRPIIDLDETGIEFKKWDFIKYNKELGTIDFYNGDNKKDKEHSIPTGMVPVDSPSEKIQTEDQKRAENTEEEPEIIWEKNNKWETALSRLIGDKVHPYKSGPNSCGRAVRMILESFGIKNPPRWHGNQWYGILKNDERFQQIPITNLSDIPAGAILTYNGKWMLNGKRNGSAMNQKYGHVEIKNKDGLYTSFLNANNPGGSARAPSLHNDFEKWKEATGFTGAFIPLAKNKTHAIQVKNELLSNKNNA